MAFKRNEPGCRCCGYGLGADLGGDTGLLGSVSRIVVFITGPPATVGNEDVLMKSSTSLNMISTLGVGTRVIGSDPDRGRILLQQTDGDIYSLEAKTHTLTLLWNSSTDVGSREIEYLYYQHDYGYGGGYTTVADGDEVFSITSTGTFSVTPFTLPSGANITTSKGAVSVDDSGNVYCGITTDVTGLSPGDVQTWYFLKNGSNDAYYKSRYAESNNGLFSSASFNIYDGTGSNIYDIYSTKAGFAGDYVVEVTGPNEITTTDLDIHLATDVKGITYTLQHSRPYSQFNVEHNTIDLSTNNPKGSWYRISKDLGLLVRLADQFAPRDLLVTADCNCA